MLGLGIARFGDAPEIWSVEVGLPGSVLNRDTDAMIDLGLLVASATIALAFAVSWLVGHRLAQAVADMTRFMTKLARGDLETPVPGLDRGDEIGRMAAAVGTFRENAIERVRLEAEQVRLKDQAERDRKAGLDRLADHFQAQVAGELDMAGATAGQTARRPAKFPPRSRPYSPPRGRQRRRSAASPK